MAGGCWRGVQNVYNNGINAGCGAMILKLEVEFERSRAAFKRRGPRRKSKSARVWGAKMG